MKHKLSARAWEILLVIDERSDPERNPENTTRFWVPGRARGADDWCDRLGYHVNINGGGDAAIIRSLRGKGLVEQHRFKQSMQMPYAEHITEDGRLLVERAMEEGTIPLELKR